MPVAVVKVLDKMMAKDPAHRYQTPAEVAARDLHVSAAGAHHQLHLLRHAQELPLVGPTQPLSLRQRTPVRNASSVRATSFGPWDAETKPPGAPMMSTPFASIAMRRR